MRIKSFLFLLPISLFITEHTDSQTIYTGDDTISTARRVTLDDTLEFYADAPEVIHLGGQVDFFSNKFTWYHESNDSYTHEWESNKMAVVNWRNTGDNGSVTAIFSGNDSGPDSVLGTVRLYLKGTDPSLYFEDLDHSGVVNRLLSNGGTFIIRLDETNVENDKYILFLDHAGKEFANFNSRNGDATFINPIRPEDRIVLQNNTGRVLIKAGWPSLRFFEADQHPATPGNDYYEMSANGDRFYWAKNGDNMTKDAEYEFRDTNNTFIFAIRPDKRIQLRQTTNSGTLHKQVGVDANGYLIFGDWSAHWETNNDVLSPSDTSYRLQLGATNIPNDTNYMLSVDGKILAEEIEVESTGAWPDYVFAPEYQLKPIEELSDFITEHGHLPGIPTAQEVNVNGIALGEISAQLLEKIEQLTLYTIAQENQLQLERDENKLQDELINQLMAGIQLERDKNKLQDELINQLMARIKSLEGNKE